MAAFGLEAGKRTLLITGASQGARTINRAIVALLEQLGEREDWQVLHLSGELDYEEVRAGYARWCPSGKVVAFTEKMAAAVAAADLIVSRAGASTLAEVTCVGRASVLLPYPFGSDRHQEANARVLEAAGAAKVQRDLIEPQKNRAQLGLLLQELMGSGARLEAMAAAAKSLGRPEAAQNVARALLDMAGL
jgi:UDP-N-acetylglucosamine--N-acetylmuramyl-(pentapeptide) pyrophosphoryl-undecaprenol N-acetylglucosamine transferase